MSLLVFLMVGAAVTVAQQGGGSAAAPKTPTNPLSSLKEKLKAPAAEQELPPALPEQPTAIALPDVAARSLVLGQMLRDAAAELPTKEQIDSIQTSIEQLEPDLQSKQELEKSMLAGTPNSLEIREEETFWRGMKSYTSDWQKQLLQWATSAQAAINMLDAQEPVWAATFDENKNNHELGPVLTVISGNLEEIRKLRKQAQDTLQTVVNLQIRVGGLDQTADDVILQLGQARLKLKGHLFDRDSLPLWKIGLRREIGESSSVFHSVNSRWISIVSFAKENLGTIVFLFLLLVASEVAAKRLYELVRGKQPADEIEEDAYRILNHWYAVGLLPPLIGVYVLAPSAPLALVGFVILLSFFPILIILPPLVHPRLRLLLYILAGLYGFNWVMSWIGLSPFARREVYFFATFLLFCALAYLVRPSKTLPTQPKWWGRLLLVAVRAGVAVIGISLVADLFGYVKLAHFLGLACVYSAFVAVGVFTTVRVANLLLTIGLRSPMAERIAAVRLHREAIARWVPRVLHWIGVAIWVLSAIQLLGLEDRLSASVDRFLGSRIAGGAGGATLGGVLGFFVILIAGYGIANAVRFVFREEILRRFHMPRGLPELITSIIYYVMMLIVVLAAVNAAGIELNKFTVLTGAFGVGIGFGLQNIINNFVSGLILQFERPVHIDDIIEVDTNIGKVTRIGIRSSTIATGQGAEVIIPNSYLISSKVTNWTLSESQRRRELPVGVAYGSDPNVVLKILREAAARHDLVLTKPEPAVYFTGFGENALNFELHFWVMQENNGLQISSEVALAAMEMFDDAGIQIPLPQRDLHLRSVDSAAASLLQGGEPHSLPSAVDREFESLKPNLASKRRSKVD